jgi:hypothetical protein
MKHPVDDVSLEPKLPKSCVLTQTERETLAQHLDNKINVPQHDPMHLHTCTTYMDLHHLWPNLTYIPDKASTILYCISPPVYTDLKNLELWKTGGLFDQHGTQRVDFVQNNRTHDAGMNDQRDLSFMGCFVKGTKEAERTIFLCPENFKRLLVFVF